MFSTCYLYYTTENKVSCSISNAPTDSNTYYVVCHHMNLRLISVIVILVASCKTKRNEWQTLDFGVFKLKTPKYWTIVERQGIDSYVGGLTNGKDSLWFDYGWYSGDIDDELIESHLFAKDTINGLFARVAIPSKIGKGVIAIVGFPIFRSLES